MVIPLELARRIKEQGYIYKGYTNSILKFLERAEKKFNIPHFSLHKLRHE